MNTKTRIAQPLRLTLQAAAAAAIAFAAMVQPAVAAETELGAGIVAAERFRAADNGSAEVKFAASVIGTTSVKAILSASDVQTADKRAPTGFAADKRAPTGFAADKRAPTGFAADKRAPTGFTADRKVCFWC